MTILGSMLIVRAPYENTRRIEEFLRQVAKQSKENLKPYKTSGPFSTDGSAGGMGGMGGGIGFGMVVVAWGVGVWRNDVAIS